MTTSPPPNERTATVLQRVAALREVKRLSATLPVLSTAAAAIIFLIAFTCAAGTEQLLLASIAGMISERGAR